MTFSFVCPGPARIRRDIGSFVSRTVRVRFRHWPAPGCAYSNHRAVTRADSYQWHANRSPWALRPLLRNRRISGKPCVCVCIFYHIHIYAIVPSDLYPSVETHPLRGRVSPARTTTELPSSFLMAPFSSERDRERESFSFLFMAFVRGRDFGRRCADCSFIVFNFDYEGGLLEVVNTARDEYSVFD